MKENNGCGLAHGNKVMLQAVFFSFINAGLQRTLFPGLKNLSSILC
jgi:hypothetical protein